MNNKKLLLILLFLPLVQSMLAQRSEFFKPYKETDLRLPSVPLLVNDPYFSFWSPFDQLTDGTTRHWSDAEKPINGLLRVDGKTYRFMGVETPYILESILPMADEEAWQGRTTYTTPSSDWAAEDFDDSSWALETGAFGSANEYPHVATSWTATNSDLYVRRTVELTAEQLNEDLYVQFSHDDVFELYLNGHRIIYTGETWLQGEVRHITTTEKGFLHEGTNVIAAHCHNTTGGAYLDYGLYRNTKTSTEGIETATQTSIDVMATSTYYTFQCGPVDLSLVFTAPMLIDDLDLLSTPVNYISYQVQSRDSAKHDVQIYFSTSPLLTVNEATQPTISDRRSYSELMCTRAGSVEQPILERTGDLISIDWGYLYLPELNGTTTVASADTCENYFAATGKIPATLRRVRSSNKATMPTLAFTHDFGSVDTASSFMEFGYDEVMDIEYMGTQYKGYWARNGKTIIEAFNEMYTKYDSIMECCRQLDQRIYDDGMNASGVEYAELLSGSYRHVIAAHKLFQDNDGNLLFFSKENNSNGCVNTVDLTYPSAPLFLMYNPELQKGMMTSIFEYSKSGRWTKPFAAHDLGTYPRANGQVYGGDMPLEESGNMLTLAATIDMLQNSTEWTDKYWDVITTWANYLVENGQDPADQLCTDDFAGHWAHNANLSVKAIMGIAGYAIMAKMRGDMDTYETYMETAQNMATQWEEDAEDGDHFRLAFDRSNTWSQKYNMVWDKVWKTNLFSTDKIQREITYYLNHQNTYGLPLDIREQYSKSDWIMWTASLADNNDDFLKFVLPLYKYVNETQSRVPISDWFWTNTGYMRGFRARSVIGGHWMKVFMDRVTSDPTFTGISTVHASEEVDGQPTHIYNLSGQELNKEQSYKGIVIEKSSDGTARKVYKR